jgi:hypothetical protein
VVARADQLRAALLAWDERGEFTEDDLSVLKSALHGVVRTGSGDSARLLDGLVGLFFERHLLDDRRRRELLALEGDALLAAVRHRFRQVVSDDHDDKKPYHSLKPHVLDALESTPDGEVTSPGFPASIAQGGRYVPTLVEQAVRALWLESRRKPTAHEATVELLQRYSQGDDRWNESSREFPEVVKSRLDAQRLARGILEVLSTEEKNLMRHVLEGEAPVETWAEANKVSRATAYRLLARIKTLCRIEVDERSPQTKLELLSVLRENLKT